MAYLTANVNVNKCIQAGKLVQEEGDQLMMMNSED